MESENIENLFKNWKRGANRNRVTFKERYSIRNESVTLYCNQKNVADLTEERLRSHFDKTARRTNYNIYTISEFSENDHMLQKVIKLSDRSHWNQTEHMGGYYYNKIINETLSLTIWPTKNDDLYGKINADPEILINKVLDSKEQSVCLLVRDGQDFFYFFNECDAYACLFPMRLIRSLLMRQFLLNHDIYFHTAAVQYKKRGILICGKSGSGKTSFLLKYLNEHKGYLISNDKVFLGLSQSEDVYVWGWPTVVNIGVGNLKQYVQLQRFLTDISEISCLQELYEYVPKEEYVDMSSNDLYRLPKKGNKLTMSHEQLTNIFDSEIVNESKVDAIVKLKLDWNSDHIELRKIYKHNDKMKILNENIISNKSDQLHWIGYAYLSNSKSNDRLYKKIIDNVKFYELTAGFQNDSLLSILDEVI